MQIVLSVSAVTTNAAAVAAAANNDLSTFPPSLNDVMNDADSQQTANQRRAVATSALIGNYVLARLLGSSLPADAGAIQPSDVSLDRRFPQLSLVPFPVVPSNDEVDSRLISSRGVASAGNTSVHSNVDGSRSSRVEQIVPADLPVRRRPVENPSRRHHELDVSKVEEMVMEWNGQRGKAHSVSNAGANLVVFAPLSPGTAARSPQAVLPTAASVKFRQLPPSTAPNSLSSLRAIVEKSLGEDAPRSHPHYTPEVIEDLSSAADEIDRVSGNTSTAELDAFKSAPATADTANEREEDIGLIARDRHLVTPATGFHIRPRPIPGATQPHDNRDEPSSVSLRLPPDNALWTINEDPAPTEPEKQLPVANDGRNDADDVVKPTLKDRESTDTAPPVADDSKTNIATTDPSVFMFTLLSATSRRADNEERGVTDDVNDDVEEDVGQDDVGNDSTDDEFEIESTEESGDVDTLRPAVEDGRRLSPEFVRVVQSLWPGLNICTRSQCSVEHTTPQTDAVFAPSSFEADDGARTAAPRTGLRRNPEHDFPAVTAWKLKLAAEGHGDLAEVPHSAAVTTSTVGARDVTETSQPSSGQVRATSSFRTHTATTSPRHGLLQKLADIDAASRPMMTRRKDSRGDEIATAAGDVKMTSDEAHDEAPKTTAMTRPISTASGVQLIDNVYDYELPGRQLQRSFRAPSSPPAYRAISTRRNGPEMGVSGAPRKHDDSIRRRGRPFHLHRLQTAPDGRDKSHRDTVPRQFRQPYGFVPPPRQPILPYNENPTVVRLRPHLLGLPERRQPRLVEDEDSETARKSEATSQANAQVGRRRPGSLLSAVLLHRNAARTHPASLWHGRTVISASRLKNQNREEVREKTTMKTPTGKVADGIGVHGELAQSPPITGSRNHEKTNPKQTTNRWNGRSSTTSEDQGENIGVDESKASRREFQSSKSSSASLTTSATDTVTSGRRLAQREAQLASSSTSTVSITRTSQSTDDSQLQTTTDKVDPPLLTLSSELPTAPLPLNRDISPTTSITAGLPMSADLVSVSPSGEGEPLPVHANPGQDGRSAAAMAMLGGYADWMVGLISAVAVAVFIFLAILSFLAVVSCRCVSSR